jgi:hypothetical protein
VKNLKIRIETSKVKNKTYWPGKLVKNKNELGILIEKDLLHDQFWRVFSCNGFVRWFEHNLEEVDINGR